MSAKRELSLGGSFDKFMRRVDEVSGRTPSAFPRDLIALSGVKNVVEDVQGLSAQHITLCVCIVDQIQEFWCGLGQGRANPGTTLATLSLPHA